ncbi:MAG TPA: choice-of-anchor L domain-containing protein, partial [Polyangiaceae bacterium]|nr:choice-of-anchor L domain-containing protein [Polyangiaceae bacterium]
PEWVCTSYNDQFVAIVSPQPVGAQNGNIVFDLMSVPMSVNMLMPVCTYSPSLPQFPCSLGAAELQGTGFDVWNDGAATSWLRTSAPVTAGEIVSIRLAIWDAGDAAWDSTVLLDNFRWLPHDTAVSVLTTPAP